MKINIGSRVLVRGTCLVVTVVYNNCEFPRIYLCKTDGGVFEYFSDDDIIYESIVTSRDCYHLLTRCDTLAYYDSVSKIIFHPTNCFSSEIERIPKDIIRGTFAECMLIIDSDGKLEYKGYNASPLGTDYNITFCTGIECIDSQRILRPANVDEIDLLCSYEDKDKDYCEE